PPALQEPRGHLSKNPAWETAASQAFPRRLPCRTRRRACGASLPSARGRSFIDFRLPRRSDREKRMRIAPFRPYGRSLSPCAAAALGGWAVLVAAWGRAGRAAARPIAGLPAAPVHGWLPTDVSGPVSGVPIRNFGVVC